ncbi:hypothetical protein [Aestuariivirga sp.]|jgi:glycosyltransferase involved in cell wall biosynthesis|uniref:hypothetical protein n=1 Tax=Aestuariivirga sp. TaxID=2650926 RepID=UPI0037837BF1
MKRLAIVSSYNEKCGNASYTHVLKEALKEHCTVDILSLDLFVLQKTSPKARALGNAHIADLAKKLKEYDYVNIQFEAGLFGSIVSDIWKRTSILIKAAPNLVFTMHRIDIPSRTLASRYWASIRRARFLELHEDTRTFQFEHLYPELIRLCKTESQKKPVHICVHTKRERRIVTEYFDFANCLDHPLVYLKEREREQSWAINNKNGFREKYGLSETSKTIGLFGYLSAYKGVETAIKALAHLPKDYTLVLFGSQHPQSVKPNVQIDQYLERLLDTTDEVADKKANQILRRLKRLPKASVGLESEVIKTAIEYSIDDRVRFIGNVPDPEFIEALRLCDAVVLPYLEVGQSMSGVVALATECGSNLYCSNNSSFAEVRKYYGDVFHSFDIGNYRELAQKVQQPGSDFREKRDAVYQKYNISRYSQMLMEIFRKREMQNA